VRSLLASAGFFALACATAFALPTAAMAQSAADDKSSVLDDIQVDVSGKASAVVGIDGDGDAKGDVDAQLAIKGSKILSSGLELGAVFEGRYDEDQPRQAFGAGRYSGFLIGGPRGVGPLSGDVFVQGQCANNISISQCQ